MCKQTSGSIEIKNGSIFVWMAGNGDGEIFGHIQKPEGGVLKGSSGWYRTNSPKKAAAVAESNLIS